MIVSTEGTKDFDLFLSIGLSNLSSANLFLKAKTNAMDLGVADRQAIGIGRGGGRSKMKVSGAGAIGRPYGMEPFM
jgi:hypothetical protein